MRLEDLAQKADAALREAGLPAAAGEGDAAARVAAALGALARGPAQARAKFIGQAAHDLRTPLSVVMGQAQMLLMGMHGPLAASQEPVIRTLRRNASELSEILNNIVDYALLDARLIDWPLSLVPLAPVVENVDDVAAAHAADCGVGLAWEIPAGASSWSNEQGLLRLLRNYISNAIKHAPSGGSVAVRWSSSGAEDRLAVVDDGPGVPPEGVGLLFEPFCRIRDAKPKPRRTRGVGLGLAVCRLAAQALGGRVGYEPAASGGACFWAVLPCGPRAA